MAKKISGTSNLNTLLQADVSVFVIRFSSQKIIMKQKWNTGLHFVVVIMMIVTTKFLLYTHKKMTSNAAWLYIHPVTLTFDRSDILTLVLLNKLRCHAHFQFTANQITWSRLLIQIHIPNDKQCRSRSVGFFRSQLIWIYTVCKGRVYPGSAGQGSNDNFIVLSRLHNYDHLP